MAHPSDPSAAAQVFVSAYHAAASAAAERSRLAQSAQQQAMQQQIERERIAQSAREAEAKLAVETEYRKEQSELKQQELAQAEKKAQMTAQIAYQKYQEGQREREVTRQFQAQQQDKREQAAGKRQQIGIEARQKSIQMPQQMEVGGQKIIVNPNTGAFQAIHPKTGTMTDYQRSSIVDRTQREIDKITETNPDLSMDAPDKTWNARRTAAYNAGRGKVTTLQQRIQKLEGGDGSSTSEAATPEALPMPKSQADAEHGKLYQTKAGPMVWNAEQKVFLPPSAADSSDEEPAANAEPPQDKPSEKE